MPSKNKVKIFVDNGFYHVYNRGVEKRTIFQDQNDYHFFMHLLKLYLSPVESINQKTLLDQVIRIKKVFYQEIELHTFCLMPNHFHLLIKQTKRNSMTEFMRSLITSYVMYFNKKYKRVGSLFQGSYKASLVTKDEYILHLSRYIHANPLGSFAGSNPAKLSNYDYSSYAYFLGKKHANWVKSDFLLSYFEKEGDSLQERINKYANLVESYLSQSEFIPEDLLLENPDDN